MTTLPPIPDLSERHFRFTETNNGGPELIHAIRPASEPYVCNNQNAPAFVLIPGLGMDSVGWVRQLPLGAISNLHLIQHVNAAVQGEEGIGHFAHCVEQYILHHKLEQMPGGLIIGGCSMGGAISQAICARGKIKPRALVLIGTFGNCIHLPFWQRKLAPLAWVLPFQPMRVIGWRVLKSTSLMGPVSGEEAKWISSFRIKRTRGYYGRAVTSLTRLNMRENWKKFSMPTLVIHGTKDRVLPLEAGKELAANIPGAKFVEVPNSGHAVFFTHAEEVNAAIAEFVAQLSN